MDFRSEMAATSQLLLKGEGIEAIERLQNLFESAVAARDARWVVLIGRHLASFSNIKK